MGKLRWLARRFATRGFTGPPWTAMSQAAFPLPLVGRQRSRCGVRGRGRSEGSAAAQRLRGRSPRRRWLVGWLVGWVNFGGNRGSRGGARASVVRRPALRQCRPGTYCTRDGGSDVLGGESYFPSREPAGRPSYGASHWLATPTLFRTWSLPYAQRICGFWLPTSQLLLVRP